MSKAMDAVVTLFNEVIDCEDCVFGRGWCPKSSDLNVLCADVHKKALEYVAEHMNIIFGAQQVKTYAVSFTTYDGGIKCVLINAFSINEAKQKALLQALGSSEIQNILDIKVVEK